MIKLAENCLKKHSSLKKVLILDHPPRFDSNKEDPTSLKPLLAKLANEKLHNLLSRSGYRNKISIGTHSLKSARAGDVFNERLRNLRTGQFDGIHLFGPTGCRDLTRSFSSILNENLSEFGTAQPRQSVNSRVNVSSVPTRNRFHVLSAEQGNF